MRTGKIKRISGPVVEADGMLGSSMYEVCKVGDEGLIGEIIRIQGEVCTIQVYEETDGLLPNETVTGTGAGLSAELAPGLIGQIYDGIQRPLPLILEKTKDDFIRRGVVAFPLEYDKKWSFKPTIEKGTKVTTGDFIGTVQEGPVVVHKVMIPPGVQGTLTSVVKAGEYNVLDSICQVKNNGNQINVPMLQKWPVRFGRPIKERLEPTIPLLTGQRIFDTFFPIAKGGTSAIPGGFGTGKTVSQHQLAKWSDAKIVVYIGCGERGNEMTNVLEDFPELIDPNTGEPLMNRTILIANTSNMPVAAREASVYTGMTLAEYYRDMGYDVALMADSTSRWAEAMREISGRLEEMPGEAGYPAYLASKIAQFYERAGRVKTLSTEERQGSITITGAVSPPGGDFSEPVTQNTLRITKVFWALSKDLAARRHFPAIDYLISYTLYTNELTPWFIKNVNPAFMSYRSEAMSLLQKDKELEDIVQLVGPEALPESEKIILESARMLKEDFLQQNAFSDVDSYSTIQKQWLMLKIIIDFYHKMRELYNQGVKLPEMMNLPIIDKIARLKYIPNDNAEKDMNGILAEINALQSDDVVDRVSGRMMPSMKDE
ncbi:MAG: V-type ATP synthase subunit A [Asgard group archaeon]|nr:V-type ATP synthase subunit A [Asgard group archaeon]